MEDFYSLARRCRISGSTHGLVSSYYTLITYMLPFWQGKYTMIEEVYELLLDCQIMIPCPVSKVDPEFNTDSELNSTRCDRIQDWSGSIS